MVEVAEDVSRGNNLIFMTEPGGQTVESGATVDVTKDLRGGIDVRPFYSIRVAGGNRVVSEGPVTFKLIMKVEGVNFLLLDSFRVIPGQQFTRVFNVPGTGLTIKTEADEGSGLNAVDVVVFGYKF
ncbi:hypothetical protein [Halobacillus litoralis]|uniref:hypothetical protein n=1 Tax=Halobacillus litoralis TaxID=45668 RepID=UPI0013714D2A|nr:hypothetical protein [Halobacillus litoralis]MYL36858.1 hypothetical protein [Halobacillus litoralis]